MAAAGSIWDVPNQLTNRSVPLRFRFHVAMAGLLAIGGDLNSWSQEDMAEAAGLVAEYKAVRHLVQRGTLHRLGEPGDEGPTVVQCAATDAAEALLLAWPSTERHGSPRLPVRLRGLDPAARYRDHPHGGGAPRGGTGRVRPHVGPAGGGLVEYVGSPDAAAFMNFGTYQALDRVFVHSLNHVAK